MTMEEAFVMTWIEVIVVGVILGLITYFVFEHDSKE